MRLRFLLLTMLGCVASAQADEVPARHTLEKVNGPNALAWVHDQNARTGKALEADSRYQQFYDDVLKVEQSPARVTTPTQIGGMIYNLWQDAGHPKGIWRRSSARAFRAGHPSWETVLDIDALAKDEHKDWVFQGARCLPPEGRLCLLALSASGEDAVTIREFETKRRSFVKGGFLLPRSKQTVAWLNRDSIVVSREWHDDPQTLTQSGYPYVIKVLQRGQRLSDAREVRRGTKQDVHFTPDVLHDEQGNSLVLLERAVDFFHSRYEVLDPAAMTVKEVDIPEDLGFLGYFNKHLVMRLNHDWSARGKTFRRGSIVAVDPRDPPQTAQLVYAPGAGETTGDIAVGAAGIVAVVYKDVQPGIAVFNAGRNGWHEARKALAPNTSAEIVSSDSGRADVYIINQGYIMPPTLTAIDTKSLGMATVMRTPDLFRSDDLVTEQYWSTSKDGTKIPYFIVHKKEWHKDGRNPVLFTAYGGFDLSYLPTYYPDLGKTWFERGGVYVVGNIRGGGEFGPAWHEAGMKSGRQRAYDDFAGIAKDLEARHVTDQKHLAIRGRSNGGLLMGVEFTQHPDYWNAVIIGVPLLDMLNFEHMAAGASWAAEYGRTSVPAERAFLRKITPLQNLSADTRYPEPFIFTSTKDDRVGPVHARLFAARLEQLHKPFYFYEDTEGGHGGTVNAKEVAHERALEAVYLSKKVMDPAAIAGTH